MVDLYVKNVKDLHTQTEQRYIQMKCSIGNNLNVPCPPLHNSAVSCYLCHHTEQCQMDILLDGKLTLSRKHSMSLPTQLPREGAETLQE